MGHIQISHILNDLIVSIVFKNVMGLMVSNTTMKTFLEDLHDSVSSQKELRRFPLSSFPTNPQEMWENIFLYVFPKERDLSHTARMLHSPNMGDLYAPPCISNTFQ